MSDALLFTLGCIVTLIVSGAVALLAWGAAQEPKGTLLPARRAPDRARSGRLARVDDEVVVGESRTLVG